VYQWIFFALTEIEAPLIEIHSATRGRPEADWDRAAIARETDRAAKALAVLDSAVAGREFLVGGAFTVADAIVAAVAGFAPVLSVPLEGNHLPVYVARTKGRPAFKRATAD
jgi:glutathione S-transferase